MSERPLNVTDINCPDRGSQTYFVVVTILACLLNFILFKLIQKESSASLKPFQIVLYTSCYVNAISALLQFSTQARPSMLGPKEILTMNFDGPLPALMEDFPLFHRANLNYLVILEYLGCYISLIYGLLPCFFRYATICWSYTLSARQYMLLFLFVLLLCLIQSTIICHLSAVHYEQNIQIIEVLPNDKCTRFVPQYNSNNKASSLEIRVFLLWITVQYFFEYSFIAVIFFMTCIYITLRRRAQMMEYSRAQIQLTWTIGVQTAIPIVCVHMPMSKRLPFMCIIKFFSYIFFGCQL
ncbi:hypothetical protein M3Y96_01036600 [Aphelenchoides besseyi]|nr:hypothetical protein M3Y96_01036600 [Aphelenchoides besseyi]